MRCQTNTTVGSCHTEKDLIADRRTAFIAWGIPALIVAVGIPVAATDQEAAAWVLWSIGLLWAGSACLVNAARCGRLHCFITGPLFVLGAFAFGAKAAGLITIASPILWAAIIGVSFCGFAHERAAG